MRTRTLVVAGALVTALTGAVVVWGAQTARDAMESRRHGPFGFMLGMHHGLRELDLTADQETQIKGILRSHREEFHDILDRLRADHEAVRKAADQETIDEAAIRERVAAAVGPLGDLAVLHARVHQEISAVLTPEQRQKAKALHQKMRIHMEGFRNHLHELASEMLEDAS